jgi:hypothetical protein
MGRKGLAALQLLVTLGLLATVLGPGHAEAKRKPRTTAIARGFCAYCESCRRFRLMQERRIVTEGGELTARGWCAVCGSPLRGTDE